METYLLELTDFLREFALVLHVLDAGLVKHVELLLVKFGLLGRNLVVLLELGKDVVSLGGFHTGFVVHLGLM